MSARKRSAAGNDVTVRSGPRNDRVCWVTRRIAPRRLPLQKQQVVEPALRGIRDASKHVRETGLRINGVEFFRLCRPPMPNGSGETLSSAGLSANAGMA